MANPYLASETPLSQQINHFWLTLRIRDESLRHQLTQRCLTHISFTLPEVTPAKAIRIALNQAQHFFDQALATHIGLDAIQDRNQLAVFRAQLLHQEIDTDFLFGADGSDWQATPVMAVPPESPLAMPQQTVTFAFKTNSPMIENIT